LPLDGAAHQFGIVVDDRAADHVVSRRLEQVDDGLVRPIAAEPEGPPVGEQAVPLRRVGIEFQRRPVVGLGGLELPRFPRYAVQWLVVPSSTEDVYGAGMERLIANGQWSDLAGQAASLFARARSAGVWRRSVRGGAGSSLIR